ncbi:TrkA family potassium uptake protein [Halorubellus sp. JP-L1]|uniref:potassium channel family protein n=1 Tax=Halorubellus sp. JP-L1 TaxID=2715753 RepID=UPI00140DB443|nr:NAD-binding protein [Halorubellus sp. JP-L1]NHN41108.1 TrkA family potassium uptake protein [Halorubellus sp. JP-L1]
MVHVPKSLSVTNLSRRNRLVVYYLTGLLALVGLYTVVYNVMMAELEGVNQSIFASLEFVVQTMTTTGYGQDSGHWSHPAMFLFVVLTQVSGIAIGFFTLRLIVIPLFADADVELDDRLSPKRDHVIVCEYRRDSKVLLDELRELGIEYVLIASDEENALELSNDGYSVIHGSPQDASAFERASIGTARAVITDAEGANVNTILTVRSVREDVDVIALTDDSEMRDVLQSAGADTVLSPHAVLGRRLAEKAISSFSAELTDTVALGADIEVTEVPVDHESPLVGTRIRDSQIRERTGANVIAAWIDGELQLPPDPDSVIRPNTVLLVSGARESLEAFSDVTRQGRVHRQYDRIVVAGRGEVGEAAESVVTDAGIEAVTIDVTERDGVDVVGDAGSREVLEAAGVAEADAVIVALPDDSTSLLTTVLARSLNEDVEILVRVSDAGATRKALSAGADYVLSVPRVSARLVAMELRGEDVLAPASQIRLVRVSAAPFAGSTLADSNIYERTGCRVIAVEDDAGTTTAVDPQRELTGYERLTLVGSDEAVQRFLKRYDVSPKPPEPE